MKFSQQRDLIVKALLAIQSEVKPVVKDRTNTFFNSNYATLDAITDYLRPILVKHELVLIQGELEPQVMEGLLTIGLETMFVHSSGQWVSNVVYAPVTEEPTKDGKPRQPSAQTAGKVITYLRRYGLSSALAITTDEDTDGQRPQAGKKTSQRREALAEIKELNEKKVTTVAGIPFPPVKGLEEYRGKPLGEVPVPALEECYRRAQTRADTRSKRIAQALEAELEARRLATENKEKFQTPHPALELGGEDANAS